MNQKPSIGRIVLYRATGGETYPAVTTKVWSDTIINLTYFLPDGNIGGVSSVHQDPSGVSEDAWRWPELV